MKCLLHFEENCQACQSKTWKQDLLAGFEATLAPLGLADRAESLAANVWEHVAEQAVFGFAKISGVRGVSLDDCHPCRLDFKTEKAYRAAQDNTPRILAHHAACPDDLLKAYLVACPPETWEKRRLDNLKKEVRLNDGLDWQKAHKLTPAQKVEAYRAASTHKGGVRFRLHCSSAYAVRQTVCALRDYMQAGCLDGHSWEDMQKAEGDSPSKEALFFFAFGWEVKHYANGRLDILPKPEEQARAAEVLELLLPAVEGLTL